MDRITFRTADGLTLEGELRLPDGAPRASAVICHPHPRHGGSKDHPLLWAIRNDLAHRGFAVLGFNFRGIMGSEGEYGGGLTEPDDVRAALDTIRARVAGPTLLAGWSFGANVAMRTAVDDDRVEGLALVGFPLSESSLKLPPPPPPEVLGAYRRPVLLLAGDADPFCPVPELRALGRSLPHASVAVLKGTDHFFPRREREAAAIIGRFAAAALRSS